MPQDAFIRFHEALVYMLSTNRIKESLKWYFDELELYMKIIKADSFHDWHDLQQLAEKVDSFRDLFVDDRISIMNHKCYFVVRERYEELMNKFEVRLDNIANGFEVSFEEVDGVMVR